MLRMVLPVIDPNHFTNYNRTDDELEEMWLFSCAAAGKTARTQARLLDAMLKGMPGRSPFDKIREAVRTGKLLAILKESGLGMYNKLDRCYRESLYLDLRNDPLERFEAIHGVGPKTARMFLMHSRKRQRYAALDVHILKHLRANGVDAPKLTPSAGATYLRLEQAFIRLARKAGMSPAKYDQHVWNLYAVA